MSITITTIKNPFEPEFNHIEVKEFQEGTPLSMYVPNLPIKSGINFVYSVNGESSTSDRILLDGDIVAVCAKTEWEGAYVVGSYIAEYFGAYSIGAAYVAGALVYAAAFVGIAYGMAALVSALGPDIPEVPKDQFGWGDLRQTTLEGTSIPILFGTIRTSGQVLQQYVSSIDKDKVETLAIQGIPLPSEVIIYGEDGVASTVVLGNLVEDPATVTNSEKEYLNVLLGICDHEVDEITEIWVNDQPLSGYTSGSTDEKFISITSEQRLGKVDDGIIPGFEEVHSQSSVNVVLDSNNTWHTRTTQGDAVQKILIDVSFPHGLYRNNDSGGIEGWTAGFSWMFREVGQEWGIIHAHVLTTTSTDAVRRTFIIDNLEPGQYEIAVSRHPNPGAYNERTCVEKSTWDTFTEIIKEKFTYPGIAKYTIRALATDQLSGSQPSISCVVKRNFVKVFDANSGTWVTKSATNPAWICYALLNTYCHIDPSRIVYDEFLEWAARCDEVIDGKPRFACSTVLSDGNMWDSLQKIARIGRGVIIFRGSKYGVFEDKADDVITHLFTMGNILAESFSLQYLSQKDRANYVELEYTDPDKDYTRQIIGVYDKGYLSDDNQQKASVSYEASLDREQVIREAVFKINSNNFLDKWKHNLCRMLIAMSNFAFREICSHLFINR